MSLKSHNSYVRIYIYSNEYFCYFDCLNNMIQSLFVERFKPQKRNKLFIFIEQLSTMILKLLKALPLETRNEHFKM